MNAMPISPEQAARLTTHILDTRGFAPEERARLDAITDNEIEQAARDYLDAQPAPAAALKRAVAKRDRRQAAKTAV